MISEATAKDGAESAGWAARGWRAVRTWGEMVKFSHSVFALPFALIAMLLAGRGLPAGRPAWGQIGLIVACMVAARSFAMTFNRLVDQALDARNPRTAGRPLVRGALSRGAAWAFLVGAAGLFVAACAGFLWYSNPWPMRLCVPVLAYLAFYSYSKRFTTLAHFVLGTSIAMAPPAAWLAIAPSGLGWSAFVLAGAVATWIAGFDIIYACQDIAVDWREGLHSLPARLGPAAALWVSRGCHVVSAVLLVWLGRLEGLGVAYWVGVGVVAVLLAVEQSLVRADDFSKVNLAFFTVNGVVSGVFAVAVVVDLLVM